MSTFTPPTQLQAMPNRGFWSYYSTLVGVSVVKRAGHFVETPYPTLVEIAPLQDGVDYFLGGRTYTVSDVVGAALVADGWALDAPNIPGG